MADPMSTGSRFSVSYDRASKIITASACVFLIGGPLLAQSVAGGCLGALIIALTYAFSPRGYIVSARSIIVRRLIGSVDIPLDSVREIRAASREDLRGCIRICANGGLFGYYGLYRTSRLGKSSWYVTHCGRAVVLVTSAKTLVFSPDNVKGFIEAVALNPDSVKGRPDSCSAQSSPSSGRIGFVIAILGALLLGILPLLYAPGPPKYTLTPEALAIHDWFFPVTVKAADVEIASVRVVDVKEDARWRPVMRTNGVGLPHYHSGWFRVAGGEKVRMYRGDGRRLVLLPPKGEAAFVLLEVAQPEAFILKVQQAWR